jgi:hypothetical protein
MRLGAAARTIAAARDQHDHWPVTFGRHSKDFDFGCVGAAKAAGAGNGEAIGPQGAAMRPNIDLGSVTFARSPTAVGNHTVAEWFHVHLISIKYNLTPMCKRRVEKNVLLHSRHTFIPHG